MTKSIAMFMLLFRFLTATAQQTVNVNKEYKDIQLTKIATLHYTFNLAKNNIYQFSILQQGIAVYYRLDEEGSNKNVYESNYPADISGYERFEYIPTASGLFSLTIKRFDDPQNTDSGQITLYIKHLNKAETALRIKIKKELEPENSKNVQTVDIDHFWEAYDNLKTCKTTLDSAASFQKMYLDKATNGLLDFIQVRDLTAEKFVKAVSENAAFYQSVRNNTYAARKAEPVIEEVFARFKQLYPNFKPFKVCFAVGIKNTGGTVSNAYVLIGTEVTTATDGNDTATSEELIKKIRGIVAHECVHTQQKPGTDSAAIKCTLLDQSLREGSCDFIGELVTGVSRTSEYGDKNENKLWTEFKNELCNQSISNWLYNGYAVKDKPADLGYYIGYKIAKEYYRNAPDKKQAIIDIIEMPNPMRFLEMSRYDQKEKN